MIAPGHSLRGFFQTQLKVSAAFVAISFSFLELPNVSAAERASGGRLAQISTRGQMGSANNNSLIAGFIVTGSDYKKIIIRVLGPSVGVGHTAMDPYLAVYSVPNGEEGYNDDWDEDEPDKIAATTIPPPDEREAAFVDSFEAGTAHTAVGYTKGRDLGLGLVEVYDLDPGADSELANISTRGDVENGDNILIAGFTVVGDPLRVIVRAIAPSLRKNLIYEKVLPDPMLELRDRNGLLLASNDNWRTDQEAEIKATTIPPSDDAESAIVKTLPEGPYTAILRSANEASGLAVVEVYALH